MSEGATNVVSLAARAPAADGSASSPEPEAPRAAALAPRYALFVSHYVKLGDFTLAAIKAGYSPRSAASTGCRLMANPEIRAAIDQQYAEIAALTRNTREQLLQEAEAAREVAERAGNAAGMTAAIQLKSRLLGLDNPRTTISDDGAVLHVHITGDDVNLL